MGEDGGRSVDRDAEGLLGGDARVEDDDPGSSAQPPGDRGAVANRDFEAIGGAFDEVVGGKGRGETDRGVERRSGD